MKKFEKILTDKLEICNLNEEYWKIKIWTLNLIKSIEKLKFKLFDNIKNHVILMINIEKLNLNYNRKTYVILFLIKNNSF